LFSKDTREISPPSFFKNGLISSNATSILFLMFYSSLLLTAEQPAIVVIFSISEGGKSLFLLTSSETKFFVISLKVSEIFESSVMRLDDQNLMLL
jgi:hypothetical protein